MMDICLRREKTVLICGGGGYKYHIEGKNSYKSDCIENSRFCLFNDKNVS